MMAPNTKKKAATHDQNRVTFTTPPNDMYVQDQLFVAALVLGRY